MSAAFSARTLSPHEGRRRAARPDRAARRCDQRLLLPRPGRVAPPGPRVGSPVDRWRTAVAARWRAGRDQGHPADARLADPARLAHDCRGRTVGDRRPGRRARFGRPAPSSSARPRRPSSAGRASPTPRSAGITRNPWNPAKTPGGSSGGSAAALAARFAPLALGTDGGGSIRIPAHFTGTFGLKPSFGRVPAWPLSLFGTLAHVGPMARTVRDAALLLDVIARPDDRDWYALPYAPTHYADGLDRPLARQAHRLLAAPRLGAASRS